MSKILIIGNVLKDVYLKMDEHGNNFETDGQGINWLELGFNGDAHKFFQRTSVYGGAAVSLMTLHQLGVDASILNSKTEMKSGELMWSDEPTGYRYIFSCKGGITYFVPCERKATDWTMPSSTQGMPEWILVDRSTIVSAKLVDELKNFLKFSPKTKLAVHAEKKLSPAGEKLAEMADLLFREDEPPVHKEEKIVDKIELDKPNTQLVCHVSPRRLTLGDAEEVWDLDRTDMMTHLTVYSTIVATILGVIAAGGTPADALLWARLNAEQATLDGSLGAEKLQELAEGEKAKRKNLHLICRSLAGSNKGVLAADESKKSLVKRFVQFGINNSAKLHQGFYTLMLTTPELKNYTSGVILSDENAKQKLPNGETTVEFLTNRGIIPGVKADLGLKLVDGETETLGENKLTQRLRDYYDQGFRFAKWRAAFKIGRDKPSFFALEKNAEKLATFAKTCQLIGLVPVVEPDIVREGDFGIEKSAEVTARVLGVVIEKLAQRHIDFAGCLLKCGMVISGADAETQATANEVGIATAAILKHAVPRYMGGVLLLSGGQKPNEATKNLTSVMQNSPFPWSVSFAFSRALEEPVLATWRGEEAQIKAAQAALVRHLESNVDALHYATVEGRAGDASGNIEVLDLS